MTTPIDDSKPAFPQSGCQGASGMIYTSDDHGGQGMSLRQYAAIALKVPDSGLPWLDEMIRRAKRDELAAAAMRGIISSLAGAEPEQEPTQETLVSMSYSHATAILAEGAKQ